MTVFLSRSAMHRSGGGVSYPEQDRVARRGGLGIGRRPQVSAAKPRDRAVVTRMRKGGLEHFGAARAAGDEGGDVIRPRAAGLLDDDCSDGRSLCRRVNLRRAHQHWSILQPLFGQAEQCGRHRAPIDEDRARHYAGKLAVGEMSVEDLERQLPTCVHLDRPDIRDIAEIRVADVIQIAGVAWPIDLARGEREPGDGRSGNVGDAEPDAGGSEKGNDGWDIDGVRDKAARNPGPVLADKSPAAVMERGKSPGLIVDPGPAPRRDPAPMAVTIGCPIYGHLVRDPEGAVFGVAVPASRSVELGKAGHRWRNVIGCRETRLVEIARLAPLDKIVSRGRLDRGSRWGIGEQRHVAGLDSDGRGIAADKSRGAFEDRDPWPPGIDVVTAGLHERDALSRNVDLDAFAGAELGQSETDPSPRYGDPHDLVVQLGDCDLGVGGEIDRVGADLKLRAGLRAGAQRITGRQRKVHDGVPLPVRSMNADISRDQAQPPDAAGWRRGRRSGRRGFLDLQLGRSPRLLGEHGGSERGDYETEQKESHGFTPPPPRAPPKGKTKNSSTQNT